MLPKEGDKVDIGDRSYRASADQPQTGNERGVKREEQFGTPWNEECGKVWIPVKSCFCPPTPLFSLTFPSLLSICLLLTSMSSDNTPSPGPAYPTFVVISKPVKAPPGNVFSNDSFFLDRIQQEMKVRNLSWFPSLFLSWHALLIHQSVFHHRKETIRRRNRKHSKGWSINGYRSSA